MSQAPAQPVEMARGALRPRGALEVAGLTALVALAALPRFIMPELVPFGYDEALEALRARAIAQGARPVANEVTSWLLPDPALMLYVYAIAEAWGDPPIARIWLLGLLNTGSVLLAYAWGREIGGRGLAFLCAGLYAVSPWATYFGRQPWVNAQPVLTSLMLLSATRVVLQRDRRWSVPFFVALGLQMQTHLLGVLLVLPGALTVLLFWRAWGKSVLIGGLIVLVINLPFALHLWELRESVLHTLTQPSASVASTNHPLNAPRLLAWFVGGHELEAKLVEGAAALQPLSQASTVVGWILVLAMGLGVGMSVWICVQRGLGWQGLALALIWLVTPLAAAMVQSRPVYIHYMTALVPACFLFVALPVARVLQAGRPAVTAVMLGLVGVIGAVQLSQFNALLHGIRLESSLPPEPVTAVERQIRLNDQEQRSRSTGIGDLVGPTLLYWKDIAFRVRDVSRERGVDTITVYVGLSDAYALYVDRRRMALDYLLGTGVVARFPFEGTATLPLEREGLALLLPGVDLGRTLRFSERILQVPVPGTRDDTRLLSLAPRPLREQTIGRRMVRAELELGVQLVSHDAPQRAPAGEAVLIPTYWTFDGLSNRARSTEYGVFFHLLTEQGEIVSQSDGLGLPSSQWQSGELLIRRVSLSIPGEAAGTRLTPAIGVYELSTLRRVAVRFPDGRTDDRVLLEPISVR